MPRLTASGAVQICLCELFAEHKLKALLHVSDTVRSSRGMEVLQFSIHGRGSSLPTLKMSSQRKPRSPDLCRLAIRLSAGAAATTE